MPIIVGNATTNSAITSGNLSVMSPQSYQVTNALRNSVRPTLLLPFAESLNVDPRITFTRASSATYFNQAGVLTTAVSNVPRIDYNPSTLVCNGLLIEQASTNLVYPSIITSSWYPSGTLTTNATVAPDNTTTGSKLIPNTTLGQWAAWTYCSTALSTTYTLSCYAKTNGYPRLWLLATDFSGNSFGATFDLSTGVFVSSTTNGVSTYISSTINYGGNGWYRCSITGIPNTSNALATALYVDNGSGNYFTGDGTSGIQIWGAQLEQTAFPTSYIATTGATATRAADLATIPLGSWYNPTASTLLVEAQKNTSADANFSISLQLDDGTNLNRLEFYTNPSSTTIYLMDQYTSNITDASVTPGSFSLSTPYKVAGSISGALSTTGTLAASLNGATAASGTTGNFAGSTFTTMRIGSVAGGAFFMNGWIQRIAYYPVAFSNTQLQAMSS